MTDNQAGWQRLGTLVLARRVELGYKQRTDFAEAVGVTSRVISDVENGNRGNFDAVTIASIEQALRWTPGSIAAVLAGGQAQIVTTASIVEPGTGERVIVAARPGREQYGDRYWIVDRPGGGFISVYADRVELDAGHLKFWGGNPEYLTFVLPPGQWTAFYAAAVIDGAPVAVDRWVEKGPAE